MATLFLSGRIAPRLLDDVQFHAAVLLTAFLGVVRRDRAGLAVAGIGQAELVHSLGDEVLVDRFGTGLGQALVVLVGALAVGVAGNFDLHLGILLQPGDDLVEGTLGDFLDDGLVKVHDWFETNWDNIQESAEFD